MIFNDTLLLLSAVLPGIILLLYIYKKDRAEKEPWSLLLLLLALGVLICFPAAFLEKGAEKLLFYLFATKPSYETGALFVTKVQYYIYNILENFLVIALIEEGLKWIVLFLATRKNKNFNSLFDGIIYAVYVSLGFAILENILYVDSYGFETALVRAVTSVPGHAFFGIIMGYYYTLWHACVDASALEDRFITNLVIAGSQKNFFPKKYLVCSFVIPVIAHGFYDFCCSIDSTVASVIFYLFLLGLYFYCFKKIQEMSNQDMPDMRFSALWLYKKHPDKKEEIINLFSHHPELKDEEDPEDAIENVDIEAKSESNFIVVDEQADMYNKIYSEVYNELSERLYNKLYNELYNELHDEIQEELHKEMLSETINGEPEEVTVCVSDNTAAEEADGEIE